MICSIFFSLGVGSLYFGLFKNTTDIQRCKHIRNKDKSAMALSSISQRVKIDLKSLLIAKQSVMSQYKSLW